MPILNFDGQVQHHVSKWITPSGIKSESLTDSFETFQHHVYMNHIADADLL